MILCYSLLSCSVFKTETEVSPGHSTLHFVMVSFGDVQSDLGDILPFTEAFVPALVKVNGTQYKPGTMILLSYAGDGQPQFGLV